ncbi:MAG: hypothetical protein JWM21_1877 [Acidobacteria bacterium]|nr:hypothetical protein [Acidobacteriota bacterium]
MSSTQLNTSPASGSLERFVYFGLFCLFLISVIIRLALTLNREIDIDEFQHLHAAWMVSQHYVLYRDFWENHSPLFYYLLMPLFHFVREGSTLVIAARIIMSGTAFVILVLVYLLARIDHDRKTSFLAVLVLSYMVIFLQKSIEVRPDQILISLWLTSLWLAIRSLAKGKTPALCAAGFLLGIAFLFSPKALLPFTVMIITLTIFSFRERARFGFTGFAKLLAVYSLGFIVPIAVCFAFYYHAGTLKAMLTFTVLQNLTYPDPFRPTYLLYLRNICFFTLAGAGLFMHLYNLRRGRIRLSESRLLILISSLLLLVLFVFFEAAPYPQSVLLCAPLLAIYGAEAFKSSLDKIVRIRQRSSKPTGGRARARWPQLLFFGFTMATALVIPGSMLLLKAHPFRRTNAEQFERMEYVLKLTRSSDVVFDGKSAYIFRPQAYFYSPFYHAVLWRIENGKIQESIPQSLISTHCSVIIYDERVSLLPAATQSFLKANYSPSAEPLVYLRRKTGDEK